MTVQPPHDPNYARLDQRVTGLEKSMADISTGIGDLAKKFDERGKTPWGVLLTGGGIMITLVGVIGAAWKAPIDSIVARQERDLQIIESSIVPRVEIDNLRASTAAERDEICRRIDRLETPFFKGAGE